MPNTLFARDAVVGTQYVTGGGFPVTVLEVGKRVVVSNNLTGLKSKLFIDQLLWPYNQKLISKEAIQMAKIGKGKKSNKEESR